MQKKRFSIDSTAVPMGLKELWKGSKGFERIERGAV